MTRTLAVIFVIIFASICLVFFFTGRLVMYDDMFSFFNESKLAYSFSDYIADVRNTKDLIPKITSDWTIKLFNSAFSSGFTVSFNWLRDAINVICVPLNYIVKFYYITYMSIAYLLGFVGNLIYRLFAF